MVVASGVGSKQNSERKREIGRCKREFRVHLTIGGTGEVRRPGWGALRSCSDWWNVDGVRREQRERKGKKRGWGWSSKSRGSREAREREYMSEG